MGVDEGVAVAVGDVDDGAFPPSTTSLSSWSSFLFSFDDGPQQQDDAMRFCNLCRREEKLFGWGLVDDDDDDDTGTIRSVSSWFGGSGGGKMVGSITSTRCMISSFLFSFSSSSLSG